MCVCSPLFASDAWEFPQVLQGFEELMQLDSEGDPHYTEEAVQVMAKILSEMGPEDFNLMVVFLLQTYYQDESARSIIYDLLSSVSVHLSKELDEQEQENVLWSTTSGALNGLFVLTLGKMGTRLSRVGIFKSAVGKILDGVIRLGKAKRGVFGGLGSGSKNLASTKSPSIANPFFKFRAWSRGHLRRPKNQYLAAAGAGGVLGAGMFFYKKSNNRIHPRKSLFAVNGFLLAEALEFAFHMHDNLAEGADSIEGQESELQRHLETLYFLLEKESHFASGVSAEQIRESLAMLEKSIEIAKFRKRERHCLPKSKRALFI